MNSIAAALGSFFLAAVSCGRSGSAGVNTTGVVAGDPGADAFGNRRLLLVEFVPFWGSISDFHLISNEGSAPVFDDGDEYVKSLAFAPNVGS